MRTNYSDIEKRIYLEVLNKKNIYKEYLHSLSDEVDNTLERYEKCTIEKIISLIKKLSYQIKKDKRPYILPILTSLDSDQTDLFESIKAGFQNRIILYIPLCPINERILYHIYSCFIEELGIEILDFLDLKSINLRKSSVIRALLDYQQEPHEKKLLKRWFLDDMTEEEREKLGIRTSIINDENSLEMIKCICDSFDNPVLLFFEDVELINQKYGSQYGERWGTKAETKFLNTLYSFFTEIRNVLIILPCSKEFWKEVLEFSSKNLQSILKSNEIELFDIIRLKRKIIKVLDFYWIQNRIRPPSNPFFPLNEDLIDIFLEKSHGNLTKFFFRWNQTIEEILMGKKAPAEID